MVDSPAARRAAALQLCLACLAIVILPLGLRAANRLHPPPALQPTYLPAVEGPREPLPFDPAPVSDLAHMNPGYVVIGDSMAGSRIDPKVLGQLTGQSIAPLLQPGTGSAWWYLALRNWVIPAGIHPRCTFIFFRDTNLTNATFRLDDQYRWALDRVAHEREDEVNAVLATRQGGSWYRVRNGIDGAYGAALTRQWMEPAVNTWPAWAMFPYRKQRASFLEALNARFGLDHLRPMEAADMQAAEDRHADFDRFIDRSFLPLAVEDHGKRTRRRA